MTLLKQNLLSALKFKAKEVFNSCYITLLNKYENFLVSEGVKRKIGKIPSKGDTYKVCSKESQNYENIEVYNSKNNILITDKYYQSCNNIEQPRKNLFSTDFEYEDKINNKICGIKRFLLADEEQTENLLQDNKYLYECVGVYNNFYIDIEYPESLIIEGRDIMEDCFEAIENDFMELLGIDVKPYRLVLGAGFKEDKKEYSFHIYYILKDIGFSFKHNFNMRKFMFYGKAQKEFRNLYKIELSLSGGKANNFIDFVCYDKERFLRSINQSKIKDYKDESRALTINEKYNKYDIKGKLSNTLINTEGFIPGAFLFIDGIEDTMEEKYNIVDDFLKEHTYKDMIKSLTGENLETSWFKLGYIQENIEKIEITCINDYLKYISPKAFNYYKLLYIMWAFKRLEGKKSVFENWVLPAYSSDISDFWNGVNLNNFQNLYDIVYEKSLDSLELYFQRRLEMITNDFQDIRFIQNYNIDTIDNKYLTYVNPNETSIRKNFEGDERLFVGDFTKYIEGKDNLIVVKSGLGTGKTYRYIEYLRTLYQKKQTTKKTLIISPRITLTNNITKRLKNNNFNVFKYKTDGKKITKEQYCEAIKENDIFVCSIESLKDYINEESIREYEYLICDEIETIIGNLYKDHSKNEQLIVNQFFMCLETIRKIMLLDGVLSKLAIDLLMIARPREGVIYYGNDKVCIKVKRTFEFIQSDDLFKALIIEAVELLTKKLKITVMFNRNCDCQDFYIHLKAAYKDIENLRILKITGDKDDKKHTGNITVDDWESYDVICYTSSLSCGVDFNKNNIFGKSLCYIYKDGCSARDIIQGLQRIRIFKNNTVSVYYNKGKDDELYNPIREEKDNEEYLLEGEKYNNQTFNNWDFSRLLKKHKLFQKKIDKSKYLGYFKHLINISGNKIEDVFMGTKKVKASSKIANLLKPMYPMNSPFDKIKDIESKEEYVKLERTIENIRLYGDNTSDKYISNNNTIRLLSERTAKFDIVNNDKYLILTPENTGYYWDDIYGKQSISDKYKLRPSISFNIINDINDDENEWSLKNDGIITLRNLIGVEIKYSLLNRGTIKNSKINTFNFMKKIYNNKNIEVKKSIKFFKIINNIRKKTGDVRLAEILINSLYGKDIKTTIDKEDSSILYCKRVNEEDFEKFNKIDEEADLIYDTNMKLRFGPDYATFDYTNYDSEESKIYAINTCISCSKQFNSLKELESHKNDCKDYNKYVCKVCDMRFYDKEEKNLHTKTCDYSCKICKKSFGKGKGRLVKHTKTCGVIKELDCKNCGKVYKSKGALNKHIKKGTC